MYFFNMQGSSSIVCGVKSGCLATWCAQSWLHHQNRFLTSSRSVNKRFNKIYLLICIFNKQNLGNFKSTYYSTYFRHNTLQNWQNKGLFHSIIGVEKAFAVDHVRIFCQHACVVLPPLPDYSTPFRHKYTQKKREIHQLIWIFKM